MQIRAATIGRYITQVSFLYFWNLLHTTEASQKAAQAESMQWMGTDSDGVELMEASHTSSPEVT